MIMDATCLAAISYADTYRNGEYYLPDGSKSLYSSSDLIHNWRPITNELKDSAGNLIVDSDTIAYEKRSFQKIIDSSNGNHMHVDSDGSSIKNELGTSNAVVFRLDGEDGHINIMARDTIGRVY